MTYHLLVARIAGRALARGHRVEAALLRRAAHHLYAYHLEGM